MRRGIANAGSRIRFFRPSPRGASVLVQRRGRWSIYPRGRADDAAEKGNPPIFRRKTVFFCKKSTVVEASSRPRQRRAEGSLGAGSYARTSLAGFWTRGGNFVKPNRKKFQLIFLFQKKPSVERLGRTPQGCCRRCGQPSTCRSSGTRVRR